MDMTNGINDLIEELSNDNPIVNKKNSNREA